MEPVFDWLSKFFESLTVLGWGIFVVSVVTYLFSSALYVMRRGGDREAWFVVIIVGVFLGAGLKYGLPKATELLSQGISGSLVWVPDIQNSVKEAFDMAGNPWGWDENGDPNPPPEATPTLTITESDVTILATSGVPISPTPEPSATPTLGSGVGGPAETPDTTLTDDEIAATAIVIQQQQATFTPRPPTAVPTLDMSIWNPQTPAPTPLNSGGN